MIKTLKKLFYPISYLINHFDDIPQDLLQPTNDILHYRFHVNNGLLTEIRKLQALANNEFFQDHLKQLKLSNEQDFPEVSYALKNSARILHTYCDRETTRNNTVICTVAIGDAYRKSVNYCLQSQQYYAAKAGADYVPLDITPAHQHQHPAWYKIPLIFKMLQEGYDRVLFIDADAMVTNYTIPLNQLFEPLTESKEVLLLAEDEGGLNTGVMLVARKPAAYRLLDLIWTYNLGSHVANWEQQSLIDLINTYKGISDLTLVASEPKTLNSFPYEREHIYNIIQKNNWTAGDFICHFAGIRAPLLEKLISHYIVEYDLDEGLNFKNTIVDVKK